MNARRVAPLLLAWIVFAATAAGISCSSIRSADVRPTGFLGDVSDLRPVEDGKRGTVYVSEPGILRHYNRFILDPVLIYFNGAEGADAVNPAELEELASALREKVAEELTAGGYDVVSDPGPDVLRVRAALTGVDPSSSAVNLGAKAAGAAAGVGAFVVPTIDLGGASIEMEMRDSRTGKRVVAFLDAKRGKRFGGTIAAAKKWGHAKAAFASWAKDFRARLDEVHGK